MKLRIRYILLFLCFPLGSNFSWCQVQKKETYKDDLMVAMRVEVLSRAEWALQQEPISITAYRADRSAGGPNDFYSEGDYWWPNPEDPNGPYIQKDGETNPDNFTAHRKVMIRFSQIMGALASAYVIVGDAKYVDHGYTHLSAWFVDEKTRMNPSLNYAQAIKGKVTGRGIGIIDTIHLMEVAQAVVIMQSSSAANPTITQEIKKWFAQYLEWLTTHPYGKEEMNWKNNHSTSWTMQVSSFATLTGNKNLLELCRDRYKNVLLPRQMAENGSFPLELERTKPYGYSLFNLDAMTTVVHILSKEYPEIWKYETPRGLSIKNGIRFLLPYVEEKNNWPYKQDVMYWEDWPVAHPFLIFGAEAYENKQWFKTWIKLNHFPEEDEVIRNLPIRNPLIWL